MPTQALITLQELFTSALGDVPPEMESLVYVFFVLFLFFLTDMLFQLLRSLFSR